MSDEPTDTFLNFIKSDTKELIKKIKKIWRSKRGKIKDGRKGNGNI